MSNQSRFFNIYLLLVLYPLGPEYSFSVRFSSARHKEEKLFRPTSYATSWLPGLNRDKLPLIRSEDGL